MTHDPDAADRFVPTSGWTYRKPGEPESARLPLGTVKAEPDWLKRFGLEDADGLDLDDWTPAEKTADLD